VLQPCFKAAVVRAVQQEDNDAPYTLGVVLSCPFIAISFNFLHIYMDLIPVVIVKLLFFKTGLYMQIHVRAKHQDQGIIVASVGTTAEVIAQPHLYIFYNVFIMISAMFMI
jgi:hypothetical protein